MSIITDENRWHEEQGEDRDAALSQVPAQCDCSASGKTPCAGCKTPLPGTVLYYVGGQNEDEPLCGACMCDALLSLRMKMHNAQVDAPSGATAERR